MLPWCPGELRPGPLGRGHPYPRSAWCLSASPRGRTPLDPSAAQAGGTVLTTRPSPQDLWHTPGQNWGVLGEKSRSAHSGAELPGVPGLLQGQRFPWEPAAFLKPRMQMQGKALVWVQGRAPLCWSNSDLPPSPPPPRLPAGVIRTNMFLKYARLREVLELSGETLDNFAEPSGLGK